MERSYKSIIADPKECLFCGIPPVSKEKVISLCEDCWNIWGEASPEVTKTKRRVTNGENDKQ